VAAYYIIKNACEEAGIEERVGTHTMRKTFGYHHYQRFKDVAMLQKMFNHSSPQITLRYIGIEQDQIDESYSNFIL
jgi:integrase